MIVSRPDEQVAVNGGHDDCLVIRDLTVAYDRRLVLQGVSADIARGQVIGVIGPNGGGKSTLLKAILGIVPMVGGSVSLFGQPASKARKRMACVPRSSIMPTRSSSRSTISRSARPGRRSQPERG